MSSPSFPVGVVRSCTVVIIIYSQIYAMFLFSCQNKDLVCFKDIYPAALHHYLVVPLQHINSCHSLRRRHIELGQFQDIFCTFHSYTIPTPLLGHLLQLFQLNVIEVTLSKVFGLLSEVMSPTVERMAEMGRAVLRDQGITDLSDTR